MHFECIPIHNTVKIFLRQKLCVFITHGLKHGEDKTQEKELKKKIKFCMKENGEDSKMRSTAVFLFEVSSKLIKIPSDSIGRRKVALLTFLQTYI